MPDALGEQFRDVRIQNDFLVIAAHFTGRLLGDPRVVQRILTDPHSLGKRDAVRLVRVLAGLRHHGHNRRGVQTGAQEGTDRYVADELFADRLPKMIANACNRFLVRRRRALAPSGEGRVPILMQLERSVFQNAVMPRRQLANSFHEGFRFGNPEERQIPIQRRRRNPCVNSRNAEQGLQFRRAGELSTTMGVVKRLDAEPVAGDDHLIASFVIQNEREHPFQTSDGLLAVLFVHLQYDFGV